MSTYGEIIEEVLDIVPFPDRESLIRKKVNQVIRYISGTGDFWRALQEVTIGADDGVEAAEYIQEIPIASTLRALLYVRYPESVANTLTAGQNLPIIKVRSPKDMLDLQKCAKDDDTAYLSGEKLRIKHTYLSSTFHLGYYSFPDSFNTDGTDDDASNWITEAVPGLLVDITAAYILNIVGDTEDSARITSIANSMQLPYIRAQVNEVIGRF